MGLVLYRNAVDFHVKLPIGGGFEAGAGWERSVHFIFQYHPDLCSASDTLHDLSDTPGHLRYQT